ncbi:MAG: FxsA family protein, partial [Actinomycetota bacterium]|nr:FxsA family protein [Actinomycetota bacterium]
MPALLLIAFIVVPIVELFVIAQVGDLIGLVPTLVILLLVSVAGAWLVRREGRAAWRNFTAALQQARIPAKEVVDGALVLVGGALLLTPGFVS